MSTPWGVQATDYPKLPHITQFVTAQSVVRSGDLVCLFDSPVFEFGITEININGPKTGLVEVWVGAERIDTTSRTDSNTATYPTPKRVPPNAAVSVRWKGITTGSATATLTTVSY